MTGTVVCGRARLTLRGCTGVRVRRVPDLGGLKVKSKGRTFPLIQMLSSQQDSASGPWTQRRVGSRPPLRPVPTSRRVPAWPWHQVTRGPSHAESLGHPGSQVREPSRGRRLVSGPSVFTRRSGACGNPWARVAEELFIRRVSFCVLHLLLKSMCLYTYLCRRGSSVRTPSFLSDASLRAMQSLCPLCVLEAHLGQTSGAVFSADARPLWEGGAGGRVLRLR